MTNQMNYNFCIFVISHNKPHNETIKSLKNCNCKIPTFLVIDDEDEFINEYISIYGKDKICIFNKTEYSKKCDMMDVFNFDKVIVYARNACYDFAEKLGFEYFVELDDDYEGFAFRFPERKEMNLKKYHQGVINEVFELYFDFYKINKNMKVLAFMQGGDFSDLYKGNVKRKSMNALFLSTKRRVIFNGRLNEDVNSYTQGNKLGEIFISLPMIMIHQKPTQTDGGMSQTYKEFGTYVKSFYSVIQNPSFVKISMLKSSHSRIHHSIDQKYGVVKILSSKYKK